MARDTSSLSKNSALSAIPYFNPRTSNKQTADAVQQQLSKRTFNLLTTLTTMAAALSALNAKIRSQPVLNYVCSTRTSKIQPNQLPILLFNPNPYHRLTDLLTHILPTLCRFLGPSLQLRHPHRRRNGHAERSRYVNITPLLALPSSLQLPTLSALGLFFNLQSLR